MGSKLHKNTKVFIIVSLLFTMNCSISHWLNYKDYNSIDSAQNGWAQCLRLDLSNQNLKEIPRDILKLQGKCLGNFRADHNQISEFPKFMCAFFKRLNYMYLEYNQFTIIPDTRCPSKKPDYFFKLNSLSYRGNQIKELPENLDILAATHVDLSHNQIDYIPEKIDWRPVMTIDLSFNKIKRLPRRLGKHSIYIFNIANNELESLPDSIGDIDTEIDKTGVKHF
ncbi:MAG: leucine-rich repeat domain-containing protein, partial [Leptospiraceae bacterium]|nr:leucine-rich repeat domain-containing protein [Leptospiraceae bacterium]